MPSRGQGLVPEEKAIQTCQDIQGVDNKVNGLLIRECEHILQALYQFIFTELLRAASVFEINAVEYVTMTM